MKAFFTSIGRFARDLFSDDVGRPSSMRLFAAVVIANELVVRWYTMIVFGQPLVSTWSDIATLSVPFLAKAAQKSFEMPKFDPKKGPIWPGEQKQDED